MGTAALSREVERLRRQIEAAHGPASGPVPLTPKEVERARADLAFFAERCLKIRPKEGDLVPLVLNAPQRLIHERLEAQRRETGRVRAVILKGRQEGCSTYVEARFYKHTSQRSGVRAYILTHEQGATDTLFEMVERFQEHCPAELRPATGAANAKELHFAGVDSGYKVGTAGTKAVGRSNTIQFFHGSEVGFWKNADTHAGGVMQAVPDAEGTEIILESTANGVGNFFHQKWQSAERGEGGYIAIFIPWFVAPEYRAPVPEGFKLSVDELEYQEAYSLDLEQMAWRRFKIESLGTDGEALFKQEYPATPAEAFQTSGKDAFMRAELVMRARKLEREPSGETAALTIGVDPARFGDDYTSIIRRRGRVAYGLERHKDKDTMQVAGLVAKIIDAEKPDAVFIDVGGLGAGVYDRLLELGYGSIVIAVNGGTSAIASDRYFNKRAEMWGLMREWVGEQPAKVPDSDTLHADLMGPKFSYDSNSRLKLERKEDMRRRGVSSPDDGDALALTFAMPVASRAGLHEFDRYARKKSGRPGGWMAA